MELKVFVDKKRNRVVFAESSSDFVDALLSFLTLPMATIVRLTRNQPQPAVIGCMNNLYKGVEDLDQKYFQYRLKPTLLRPGNSSEYLCRKLKLNIDDTEPTKFYICDCCGNDGKALLGLDEYWICKKGARMKKMMHLIDEVDKNMVEADGGVFVKGTATFIITDDLKVMPASPSNCIDIFSKMGIKGVNSLEQMTVKVCKSEVLSLLRLSFGSKTPLSDLFLSRNTNRIPMLKVSAHANLNNLNNNGLGKKMRLKLILRKSDSKILYAETDGSFVNHILSQLVMPLGTIMELLLATQSRICISNLYTSVADLVVGLHLKSENMKKKLLSPKLGPDFRDLIRPLGVNYDFCTPNPCKFQFPGTKNTVTIDKIDASDYERLQGTAKWFVESNVPFMITDDLTVAPLSSKSCIAIFNKLNVSISNMEEKEICFGKDEALRLLEASLISHSALTSAFSFSRSAKKPKLK